MALRKKKEEIDFEGVNEVIGLSKKILKIFYIVLIIAIGFFVTILVKEWGIHTFLLRIIKVLSPLFIGFVIAWLFNPFVVKLEKKGLNRVVSSLIIYMVFIAFIIIFLRFLVPTVYNQLDSIYTSLPGIMNVAKTAATNFLEKIGNPDIVDIKSLETSVYSFINSFTKNITSDLPQTLFNGASSIISAIGTLGLGLGFGLYMLFDFNNVSKLFLKIIPKKSKYEVEILIKNIGIELRKCVNGTLTVASMVFITSSIGFWAVGLEAPILFGLLCGITDVIPYIGPWIGGVAAVAVGFSQGLWVGILVLIVILIVQLVENMIFQPIVMGKSTNLHPVIIMVGLLLFGNFFGMIGMILATPILSLSKVLLNFISVKFNLFEDNKFIEYNQGVESYETKTK